ncbi:hypothetical protein [Caulobacter sp. 17J65-9]|uniref:hypothetical protein n=1 Tax=Caulobacter sp. 17J65-9 TaxID=2709382 RepID=UPI0013C7BA03|nr:hypothetical protein [Caulobacter sp. 17J65-9]NEX92416.1 hypothetical protein [Caulobacter sp. 17J65-9]
MELGDKDAAVVAYYFLRSTSAFKRKAFREGDCFQDFQRRWKAIGYSVPPLGPPIQPVTGAYMIARVDDLRSVTTDGGADPSSRLEKLRSYFVRDGSAALLFDAEVLGPQKVELSWHDGISLPEPIKSLRIERLACPTVTTDDAAPKEEQKYRVKALALLNGETKRWAYMTFEFVAVAEGGAPLKRVTARPASPNELVGTNWSSCDKGKAPDLTESGRPMTPSSSAEAVPPK